MKASQALSAKQSDERITAVLKIGCTSEMLKDSELIRLKKLVSKKFGISLGLHYLCKTKRKETQK